MAKGKKGVKKLKVPREYLAKLRNALVGTPMCAIAYKASPFKYQSSTMVAPNWSINLFLCIFQMKWDGTRMLPKTYPLLWHTKGQEQDKALCLELL
jgi:hypothetical protein